MTDERLVPLSAVHNFRDLGGYPAAGGRTTRWRTLYRADGLYRLTGDDLEVVRALGLRTVIDLRTEGEIAERGRFPHEQHPVTYHHTSVMDLMWADMEHPELATDVEYLHHAYSDMLANGAANFATAINHLAAPGALPAVFHCAAGKDRTGILAALVLGALGVPHEHIVADYALTAAGMARLMEWAARTRPDVVRTANETPSWFMAAEPDAMARLLADLVRDHGSVRAYVVSIGVAGDVIDALGAGLLEG